jgi:hypothetical protein
MHYAIESDEVWPAERPEPRIMNGVGKRPGKKRLDG